MAGIRAAWNHIVTSWQMVGMMVVIFVVLDLIAAPFVHIYERGQQEKLIEERAAQYDGAKWALNMFHEEDSLPPFAWHPYDYWSAQPYKGKYFNIGSDGLRRTFNDVSATGGKPFRIFVFGGSTLYGLGARDDYTIPSFLARDLAKDGIRNIEVFNYGQPGYSSTQEVIRLFLQLRQGDVPNLVIFYDGVNDTVAAYQYGAAGLTSQEYNRAREFNVLNPKIPSKRLALYTAAAITFVNASALGKVVRGAMLYVARPLYEYIHGWLPRNRAKATGKIMPYWGVVANREMKEGLPRATVETYIRNMLLVEQAGRDLSFKCLFYWQPIIYWKNPLSHFEKRVVLESGSVYPGLEKVVRATYADAHEASASHEGGVGLHDISDILNGEKSCFWDPWHITENCDAVVAARIEKDVLPIVTEGMKGE